MGLAGLEWWGDMVKPGDIVFFKKVKRSSLKSAPESQFQGHGFGVLLGHVSPFLKDPPGEHILRLLGTVGFISFDEVKNVLGDEACSKLITAFENKYYPGANAGAAVLKTPDGKFIELKMERTEENGTAET